MQGIARALQIFEHVATLGPIGVSDLARRVELPKSTTQRHLLALAEAGWIRAVGESDFTRWVVTPRALMLSQNGSREGAIAAVAVEFMTKLRDEIDETVVLQVPKTAYETTYIAHVDSQQPVRTFIPVGMTGFITLTAGGLAMLAHRTPEEIEDVLSQHIPSVTSASITDPAVIRAYLPTVKELGYSVSRGQNRPGVRSVAAAVLDSAGRPVAGLGISFPESRFDESRIPEWGQQIRATAAAVSARM